ncbi:MAG: hypothetical protein AB1578_20895 [Thermodesulfobacteriota bacterium]
MRPTIDTARPRPDIGVALSETMAAAPAMGFIGLQLLPVFRTPVSEGTFEVVPVEALHNLRDDRRKGGGHYNRDEAETERGMFLTRDRGLEARKDRRTLKTYGSDTNGVLLYERVIAQRKLFDVLRAAEKRIADKIINTTNFPTPLAAGTAWDAANSDPRKNVNAAKKFLKGKGVIADTLAISWNTFMNLSENAAIQTVVYQLFPEAAKSGQVTIDHLRVYFDLPKILVGGAMYNSANPGLNATLAEIWPDTHAWVGKTSASADLSEPCVGRTFLWTGDGAGGDGLVAVEDYPDEPARSDIVRVRWDVDERLLATVDDANAEKSKIYQACGKLISGIKT